MRVYNQRASWLQEIERVTNETQVLSLDQQNPKLRLLAINGRATDYPVTLDQQLSLNS